MNTLTKQYVIGIAGASNSGKTTMTGKLTEYLQSIGYNVTCLQMDDYYWIMIESNFRKCHTTVNTRKGFQQSVAEPDERLSRRLAARSTGRIPKGSTAHRPNRDITHNR
ncbi:Nicotinamide riboside kinase, variant 3 [Schistosoma haematobium]|uniref:Nicotinamide riboside kinase, variant 3 n=1 Tax=Schistosoma haematobium TaxID=6185 RepID=A0A922IMN4_SCHHA|nr:Nicotinamide riboside kinase, variant 3 [Schistosoma haematobium]KAH9583032.1 Nicotinamide riboside kinase, variant 3 [Schistosoma haematobium]